LKLKKNGILKTLLEVSLGKCKLL